MKIPRFKWPAIDLPPQPKPLASRPARLLWMAGIWAGSVLLLLLLAGILRLVLNQ